MSFDKFKNFTVVTYGQLKPITPVSSLIRCRIFYKYDNRNGTYISDEFAEKLINTLPYTPLKGIYDNFEEDYTDHGAKRSLGRIYGIVPENPNFAWEDHEDEDGVVRQYACCDVIVFTALYDEANEIVGKAQSMELYEPSIKGEMFFKDGKEYFRFSEGCFLGLQILGKEVEPCFEGAAFYSYCDIKDVIEKIEKYCLNLGQTGEAKMEKLNFKLSDNQKFDALWSLLNTEYNEASGWIIGYAICDIYDEYALAFNYGENCYERIYYTKNDNEDSIVINQKKKCYVIDVTEDEKNALESLRAFNGGTYEKIDEKISVINELTEQNNIFSTKNQELQDSISTLTIERDKALSDLTESNQKVEDLNQFKLQTENKEKKEVLSSYSSLLPEDVLNKYNDEKLSEYSALELDKELAFELKNCNLNVFTKAPQYVPKDDFQKSGIEAILDKYKK